MKGILIQSVAETLQDPKAATAILVGGATAGTGTVLEWLPVIVGVIASLASIVAAFFVVYFHSKKNEREDLQNKRKEELYKVEMEERLIRIEKLRGKNENAPKQS